MGTANVSDQLGSQKDQVRLQKLQLLQNSDNFPHPLPKMSLVSSYNTYCSAPSG